MTDAREAAIAVEGLVKRFGARTAVDHVSITVARGSVTGFLGPNGAGKTTTLRLLTGLLRPDAGRGRCLGFDILTQSRRIKEHVGYMPQRFGLYEDLTVRENLLFAARVHGLARPRKAVDACITRQRLAAYADTPAGALSGGWKQRLALAAAVIHRPALLLLDEPTAGVDPEARRRFWDEIHRLAAEEGVTVLVSTHYMDEAERCHDIAYIFAGRILARGRAEALLAESGLIALKVTGPGLAQRLARIERAPGVIAAGVFGGALHLAGEDRAALEKAVATHLGDLAVEIAEEPATLEDLFIALVRRAGPLSGEQAA